MVCGIHGLRAEKKVSLSSYVKNIHQIAIKYIFLVIFHLGLTHKLFRFLPASSLVLQPLSFS